MDYYSILGVPKTASPEEIKKAYRKLASQHHPDKGGDTATFQNIQAAYDILGNTDKRREYDNPPFQFGQGPSNPGGFNFSFNGGPFDMNDIFSQVFGQQRQAHRQVFRTHVNVSLQDAYTGISHVLKLQSNLGTKVVNIQVPIGVNQGDQIRYDNIIENGILIVEFNILPDLRFERKGNDLYCNHSISVLDLIVGTSFEVNTISNKTIQVQVRPKTQPYMQLKLSGQGMPIGNSGQYGDQIILLKPFIPDSISDDIVQSILRSKNN